MNNGFKRFTNPLFNNVVKMLSVPVQKMFGMSKPSEIFYTIKNGLWTDISVWETVSGRPANRYPTANDDVYIKHTIRVSAADIFNNVKTIRCNNLWVSGKFILDSITSGSCIFYVGGNLNCSGVMDFSLLIGPAYLVLGGEKNYINLSKLIAPTVTLEVEYAGNTPQEIMDFPYMNMRLNGGDKYLVRDLYIPGTLVQSNSNGKFDLSFYSLTVDGNFTNNGGTVYKIAGGGNILVKGVFTLNGVGVFMGSYTIELRNGLNMSSNSMINVFQCSSLIFSTNNQTITCGYVGNNVYFSCPVLISGPITLSTTNGIINFISTVNGDNALSTLKQGTSPVPTIVFTTQLAAENSMTTGLVDFTSFANTVVFGGNYSATISPVFTIFHGLTINGTGTKTLGVNTALNGNLLISTGALLDCGTKDLTVTGTTTVGLSGAEFRKSGAGNLLFIGGVTGSDGNNSRFNLSGNPNVEFRGGFTVMFYAGGIFNSGTGTWTFTTNNQTLSGMYVVYNLNCTIIVSGITLLIAGNGGLALNGTIDGTNPSSVLNLNGKLYLANAVTTLPMTTNGTFNHMNASTSVLGFILSGNYTLPYTSYYGLSIGNNGTKTLLGNTTCTSFSVYGSNSPIFELSTFDFTVNGTTTINDRLLFQKSGAGNILFVGSVTMIGCNNYGGFNFTGNPTVEFRGGFTNGGAEIVTFNTGTGLWSFTTNNQSFTLVLTSKILNCPILISGAITVTFLTRSNPCLFFGIIDGNNANSKLLQDINSDILYYPATQPMATGLLDTSTNANTFRYSLSGNQDVKGGTYRTLNFGGSGVKKLQGNVTVPAATYTVTGTATVDLNGFTLTLT